MTLTPAELFALGVAQAIAEADEDDLVSAQERNDWGES